VATENERTMIEHEIEEFDLNLDELEQSLETELMEGISGLDFLKNEGERINNPDHLGETIKNVVWEQFMNQVAATAGEDFIKENNGLHLDLRNEAHIQTTENFADGKIATHNTKVDYQQRYDDWQSNFQKDPNIEHKNSNYRYNEDQQVWEKHDSRSDSWKKVLNKDARSDFDKGRPTGKNTANTNMDHTVSAGEIIRDPAANAHMTREEQIAFANSDKNLNLMDSAANQSKGDSTMSEFLNSEKDGAKAAERFNIDEEALRKKDTDAREEYEKQKKEAEGKSVAAGKQSQKEEAFRIGGKALRTALMTLFGELIKEIIGKLVLWFKSAGKSLNTLLEHMKMAIRAFVGKLKDLLVSTTDSVITTIVTSIVGPVVGTIKKVFTLLKQGWKSLKEAVQYLRKPENRGRPLSELLPQVGIIVVTGLGGIGAIVLGEIIEKGIIAVLPGLGADIPVLGSPANLIGMLMGAIVCGIIGAIAINLINKQVERQQKNDNLNRQIDQHNQILETMGKLTEVKIQKLERNQEMFYSERMKRRIQAKDTISDALTTIFYDDEDASSAETLDKIGADLDSLFN